MPPSKSSIAYVHTKVLRLEPDGRGRSYEVRGCRFCNAEFSFKGGTTSAALRHLKRVHTELPLNFETSAQPEEQPAPARPKLTTQQPQPQLQQKDEEHDQAGDDDDDEGDDEHALDADRLLDGSELLLPPSPTIATVVPSALLQQVERVRAARRRANDGRDAAAAAVLRDAMLRESAKRAATARPSPPLPQQPKPQQRVNGDDTFENLQEPRGGFDRKRQRVDDETEDTAPPASTQVQPTAPAPAAAAAETAAPALSAVPLTASQQAITHFLQHYKELLPARSRLRFVKHLTHHPREAEMYNVLDTATQVEFVREFAGPNPV